VSKDNCVSKGKKLMIEGTLTSLPVEF
jgi:hypothetical protein